MAKPTRIIRVPAVTVPERHLDIIDLNISPRSKRGMVVLGQVDGAGNPIPNSPSMTLLITSDEQYDALYNEGVADALTGIIANAGVMFQQMPPGTEVTEPKADPRDVKPE